MNETNTNQVTTTETKVILSPIFLLFAEFFGYVSPLIDMAENICEGKKVSSSMIKLINIEAKVLFHEMQQEFTITEIAENYKKFYPLVLQDYDTKLRNDLPF